MRRTIAAWTVCGLLAAALSAAPQAAPAPEEAKNMTAAQAASVLDFTLNDIEGKPKPLADYKGKVLLIVNVASRCGYTPQYEQLQNLHEKYAEKGLAVLAFPANNFGGQEPGTDEEIRTFCTKNFGVQFDLFSKISVKGDDAADLYRFLTDREKNGEFGGDIRWNFTKFLVDREGKVVARYESRTRPDDPQVIAAIERALGE